MIHPEFKLNGKGFSSDMEWEQYAITLINDGNEEIRLIGAFLVEWLNQKSTIAVKTSGSTGVPKMIELKKKHVINSAKATIQYFELFEQTTALLCLSSSYIAGKMMLVRAMVGGWHLHVAPSSKNPLKNLAMDFDFAAMVPYQVFHSMEELEKVRKIIIGGGSIPALVEKQLQQLETLAFATYGMTETISHIAVRQINGPHSSGVFSALPSVSFSQDTKGCLQIDAPRVSDEIIATHDVVHLLSPTAFRFLGRLDNVINSGGIKIHPEEVEKKLSTYIETPFFIASESHPSLGEQVILIAENNRTLQLKDFSRFWEVLSPYERPKKLYTLPRFRYTETEKIQRAATLRLLGL